MFGAVGSLDDGVSKVAELGEQIVEEEGLVGQEELGGHGGLSGLFCWAELVLLADVAKDLAAKHLKDLKTRGEATEHESEKVHFRRHWQALDVIHLGSNVDQD